MKLGIKVAPRQQSIQDLQSSEAQFCEVWFNIGDLNAYEDLFNHLRKHHIETGLHFWGQLPDGIWVNTAYPDRSVIKQSLDQIKKTIDIAAQNNFVYVNIHPGNRALVKINFDTSTFKVISQPIDYEISENLFLESLTQLTDYAKQKGVMFTTETVPSMENANNWKSDDRSQTMELYTLHNSTLVKAATMGFTVANDFGHTSAGIISTNRSVIHQKLFEMTKKLQSQTKLLHLGYIIPPYNGTDYHDHLDNPLFVTDKAVPNRQEMIELLDLFKNRNDVWALVEPENDHVKNYHIAKELLNKTQDK